MGMTGQAGIWPSLKETEFLFRRRIAKSRFSGRAKYYLDLIRGPLWELRVLRHRNWVREEARRRNVRYCHPEAAQRIRRQVRQKGIEPKSKGDFRIYTVYYSRDAWTGDNLSPAFRKFGAVRHFELLADWSNPYRWFREDRTESNRRLLEDLICWQRESPIDVFFFYGGGIELQESTLERINELGIATFSLNCDDMSGLSKGKIDGIEIGLASIARYFDMCFTITLATCEEYLLAGANPYFLPLAANPEIYRRLNLNRDIPLAVFGQRHGVREALVRDLQRKGLRVQAYGPGWDSGRISAEKAAELFNRTEIVVGHAHHTSFGVSSSVKVTTLRQRDFEIPMCGALHLTTFDPDLQRCYAVGEEVVCYRTVDDLYDTIEYLLNQPRRMQEIRDAGWRRAQRDHTWERRIEQVFRIMGVLESSG